MKSMFLDAVERHEPGGPYASIIPMLAAAGQPVPQIMRLFAYK
jgi:hypothetical protein